MSSTNKTANYELSQYIGSDKPTYLVDYNGDMLKIDTGMAANKAQADATDLVVAGHTSSISGLQGTVSDQGTAITGLITDVDGNTGSINTINSLIGNGEPTTTDKTLIGAINELDTHFNSGYKLVGIVTVAEVTGDGVKTASTLLAELHAALIANCASLGNDLIDVHDLAFADFGLFRSHNSTYFLNSGTDSFDDYFDYSNVYADGFTIARIHLASNSDAYNYGAVSAGSPTYFNYGNEVIPNGYKITITGLRYTPV